MKPPVLEVAQRGVLPHSKQRNIVARVRMMGTMDVLRAHWNLRYSGEVCA